VNPNHHTPAGRFDGKVALVTGAGSGIGRAAARQLLAQGAQQVVFADIDLPAAQRAGEDLPGAGAAQIDVSDSGSVDAVVSALVSEAGRLDVVIHAAGVDDPRAKAKMAEAIRTGEPYELIASLSDADWHRMITVNLDGTFYVLRAAVRQMIAQRSGAVVVVGSSSSFDAPMSHPHYSAAKAGVKSLAQSVAKEVIAHGVRVNVLAPGPTETGMAERTPDILRRAAPGSSVSRYASADEMAGLALFLASDEAVNVVGGVLLANGGRFTA
jgi:3-oxoacyl-[acyl-carrier protein] reductase